MQHDTSSVSINLSRRKFMGSALGTVALLGGATSVYSKGQNFLDTQNTQKIKFCIFSKHLHWLDYTEMARTVAELGFDGIDLTVRPDGHVLPKNVEKDLPLAVEAAKKAGTEILTLTTAIDDSEKETTQKILKTASQSGVAYYRLGYFGYNEKRGIPEQLISIKQKMHGLMELNQKFKIHGAYQNHSGNNRFGAAIWDLWETIKERDSRWIGVQFDVRHATVEGANIWPVYYRLIAPFARTLVLKDFYWEKTSKGWQLINCPLGEGMVNWKEFFRLVKTFGKTEVVILHYEYPLGGVEHGHREFTIEKSKVLDAFRRDLTWAKSEMKAAGLQV
ncbi:TIM barrel protein [candidate division KSB1 bacterium]|nr:TIM barrel protein [candidate division KSB1 bacterium]